MRKAVLILSVVVAVALMVRVGFSGDEPSKNKGQRESQAYARVENYSVEEEFTVVGKRQFPVRLQLRGQKMPMPRSYQVYVYVYTNDPLPVLVDRRKTDVYKVAGGDGIQKDISFDIPFKPGEYTFQVWVTDRSSQSSPFQPVPEDPNIKDGFWAGGMVANMRTHELKVID